MLADANTELGDESSTVSNLGCYARIWHDPYFLCNLRLESYLGKALYYVSKKSCCVKQPNTPECIKPVIHISISERSATTHAVLSEGMKT